MEAELRSIHKTFGHLTVKSTKDLLKRATLELLDEETRSDVIRIAETFQVCHRHYPAPRRYKMTFGTSGMRFNHQFQMYKMFIRIKPVLHMV